MRAHKLLHEGDALSRRRLAFTRGVREYGRTPCACLKFGWIERVAFERRLEHRLGFLLPDAPPEPFERVRDGLFLGKLLDRFDQRYEAVVDDDENLRLASVLRLYFERNAGIVGGFHLDVRAVR